MSYSFTKATILATLVMASTAAFAQNSTTTTSTFDGWSVRCTSRMDQNKMIKLCQVDHTAMGELPNGQTTPVLGMTLQRNDPAAPMKFHVNVQPLSMIQNGVSIADGANKEILKLSYDLCRTDWCETSTDIKDAQIQALRKLEDDTAYVLYQAMTQKGVQPLRVKVSMKGFGEAYDAMIKEMGPKK